MAAFELVTRYTPAGDQPEAIRQMVKDWKQGCLTRPCWA